LQLCESHKKYTENALEHEKSRVEMFGHINIINCRELNGWIVSRQISIIVLFFFVFSNQEKEKQEVTKLQLYEEKRVYTECFRTCEKIKTLDVWTH